MNANAVEYGHLGDMKMQQGNYLDAIADYEEALRHTHKDIKETVDLLLKLGNAFRALQNYTASIERYRQALKLNIQNPHSHYYLACALEKIGHHQQAITEYTTTIRLAPEYIGAYLNRGNILSLCGHHEEARQDFEVVLDLTSSPNIQAGTVGTTGWGQPS